MAGPCAVEDKEVFYETARKVKKQELKFLEEVPLSQEHLLIHSKG